MANERCKNKHCTRDASVVLVIPTADKDVTYYFCAQCAPLAREALAAQFGVPIAMSKGGSS